MGEKKALRKLQAAAFSGSVRKVEKVLHKYRKEVVASSKCDDEGNTILHIASKWGHHTLVEHLLDENVSVDARNDDGNTPLHLAIIHSHPDVVKKLIAAGAPLHAINNHGTTCQELLDALDQQRRRLEDLLYNLDELSEASDQDDYVAREDNRRGGKRAWMDTGSREDDFQQRLWDEMDPDDSLIHDFEEQGYRDLPHKDDWRDAIANAMRRKRQQQHEQARSQSQKDTQSNSSYKRRMQGPAWDEEAKRRSDRIIQEQLEKEKAVRGARTADRIAQLRQDYERKWGAFETRREEGTLITYEQMPWPCERTDDIKGVMMSGIKSSDAEGWKARVRSETRRWHPDKWRADSMEAKDQLRILDRVKLIVQLLNDLKEQKPLHETNK